MSTRLPKLWKDNLYDNANDSQTRTNGTMIYNIEWNTIIMIKKSVLEMIRIIIITVFSSTSKTKTTIINKVNLAYRITTSSLGYEPSFRLYDKIQ